VKRPRKPGGKAHYAAGTFAGEGGIRADPDHHSPVTLINEEIDAWRAMRALINKEAARKAIRAATEAPDKPAPARRRGPKPRVRTRVIKDMLDDLQTGRLTAEQLQNEGEDAMVAGYNASRDTCRKARQIALSEFRKRQTPTIDK
jgi:hypothetical protein